MASTVDVAYLLRLLLIDRLPDVTWYAGAGPGVDAAEHLPLGVVTPTTGTRVGNGGPGLGQTWQVPVSLVAATRTGVTDLAMTVHDVMHDLPTAGSTDVGWVAHVDDVAMFSPGAQDTVSADDLYQQDAVYTVIVRK